MLKSKLSTKYKTADSAQFLSNGWQELDPIFAGRLAHLCKVTGCKIVASSAYRSRKEQERMYALYLVGQIRSAAKPGTSWHEYRLALDTSTQPIRRMTNEQLKPYGLCKPISYEGWHIQPIETAGETDRRKWAPEEVEDDMTESEVKKIIEESKTVYKTANDIPDWGKPTISRLIKKGAIKPDASGAINITHEMLRILVIMDREDD